MGEIQQHTLKNGMRLVMVPMPSLQSLTVLAMVGVGSRFEDPKLAGISHFLEHLPFKGTDKYATALDLAEAVDGVGGKHNAFTGKEYTGYWVKVATRNVDLALEVVSDLLLTPRLREEDIERERGVIIEEINMYEDEPRAKVASLFDKLVYKGTGLEIDPAGTKESVSGITRDDFWQHYDRWYDPANVVIGIVGGIRSQESGVRSQVEGYFSKGGLRKGGGERVFGIEDQKKPRSTVFYKDTEQAHFYLGFPGLGRTDEDRYALSLMTTILGGNSSSRLFNEIREKRGLAYYAYASMDVYQETGSVYALEGVALDKAEEAIKVTLGEFERMRDGKGLTAKKLAAAKEYVIGKTTLDLEDSSSMASLVVRKALLEGKVETVEEMIERIKAVSLDEVKQVASRVIDFDKLNLSLVGPFKSKNKFGELVGVGN